MKQEKMKRKFRRNYFSMMEMLIVIAIMALLAGIGLPAFIKHLENAKRVQAKAQIDSFGLAVNSFYLDTKKYPKSLEELIKNPGIKRWRGPYLQNVTEITKDPWDNDYEFNVPGADGRDFDIISYGKDGTQGGEVWDADIVSWKKE